MENAMVIDRKSWHVRLYMLAWLFDRAWFEWFFIPEPEAGETTDLDREYGEVCKQIDALYIGWDYKSSEERKEITEYAKPFVAKRDELRKKLNVLEKYRALRIMAQERIDAKKRFSAGKLALCPYFWSVVLAITVYLPFKAIGWMAEKTRAIVATVSVTAAHYIAWPFVKIGVWAGGIIRNNQETIRRALGTIGTGAGKLAKVALLLAVGYAGYGLTNFVTSGVEQWRLENERFEIIRIQAQQYERTAAMFRETERLAYERAQAERRDADAREAAEYEAYKPSAEALARQTKQDESYEARRVNHDAIYAARTTMWHIENDLATYAAWTLFFKGLALLCAALFLLAPAMTFFRRKVWTHAKVQATRASTASGWESFSRWFAETYELAAAFAKASKEKVCPYIHFVDDEQTNQKH